MELEVELALELIDTVELRVSLPVKLLPAEPDAEIDVVAADESVLVWAAERELLAEGCAV